MTVFIVIIDRSPRFRMLAVRVVAYPEFLPGLFRVPLDEMPFMADRAFRKVGEAGRGRVVFLFGVRDTMRYHLPDRVKVRFQCFFAVLHFGEGVFHDSRCIRQRKLRSNLIDDVVTPVRRDEVFFVFGKVRKYRFPFYGIREQLRDDRIAGRRRPNPLDFFELFSHGIVFFHVLMIFAIAERSVPSV